jgi:hypothetical protein
MRTKKEGGEGLGVGTVSHKLKSKLQQTDSPARASSS